MLRPLALLLFLSTTLWSVGLARYIPCESDRNTDRLAERVLELPWGKYKGKATDSSGNVTVFKNVRYGKAPTGNLRFKKSEFPDAVSKPEFQDQSSSPVCIQAGLNGSLPDLLTGETEDCLFLDLYVPTKAFDDEELVYYANVYLYGGAFILGYKDTTIPLGSQKLNLYDGKSLLDASGQDHIWVVGNYRVGAYGWLAGESMEAGGTPNAGLHDQKLLIDFVEKHIKKVNGNPESITVWGNSAGASSIMHHLTAGDNGRDGPNIKRAVLWSPAYQWFVDRKGGLENTFKSLAEKVGCTSSKKSTLDCLRGTDDTKLRRANQEIVNESLERGIFPYGPALDGAYVKRLPNANLWRGGDKFRRLESVIVSHVLDEAGIFLPKLEWVNSEENFQKFLNQTFPGPSLQETREAIAESYKLDPDDDSKIAQSLRVKRIMAASTFLCNSNGMLDAYETSWGMQFNFPPAFHGSDLPPFAWNKNVDTGKLIDGILGGVVNETVRRTIQSNLASFSKEYQSYFASYAALKNPNYLLGEDSKEWPESTKNSFGIFDKVLHVGLDKSLKPSFTVRPDFVLAVANCYAWWNIAHLIDDGTFPDEKSNLQGFENNLKVQPELQSQEHGSFSSWEL